MLFDQPVEKNVTRRADLKACKVLHIPGQTWRIFEVQNPQITPRGSRDDLKGGEKRKKK